MSLDPLPGSRRFAVWRDLAALLLLLTGWVGMLLVALDVDLHAAWAWMCLTAITVGVVIGYERE